MNPISRRTFTQASLGIPLLAGLAGVSAPAYGAPKGEEELNQAPVMPAVSVPRFGTTVRADGTPIAVVVSGGAGGTLNIINLATKTAENPRRFADESFDVQPWGFATLPDKTVLIAAGKNLFSYDPNAKADANPVMLLSDDSVEGFSQVKGYDFMWDVVADENGTAYIATQRLNGGGAILTYRNRVWSSLNGNQAVVDGVANVRCLAWDAGKLYASLGDDDFGPAVYEIDPASGTKRAIQIPSAVGSGMIHQMEVLAGVLYVYHPDQKGTTAIKLSTGGSLTLPGAYSAVVRRPDETTKVYLLRNSSGATTLDSFDPTTDTFTTVATQASSQRRLSRGSWVTKDIFVASDMQSTAMTITDSGKSAVYKDLLVSTARAIQSLVAGPDGNLYAGCYMTAEVLMAITPGAAANQTQYRYFASPNGQAEGMAAAGDHLVSGLYEGGRVVRHSLSNLTTTGAAPAIELGQNRPYAVTHISGDLFAIGSVPSSGREGALALYDAATETIVWRARLADLSGALAAQSPIALAHRDGKLYIGTTTRGYDNTVFWDQRAHLAEFDIASRTITKVASPFPERQGAVTALLFASDGQLYGITGQYVFRVDRATLNISSHAIGYYPPAHNRSWLVQRGANLYAVVDSRVHAVPLNDFSKSQRITSQNGVSHLVLGTDGYLYYARGSRLFRHDHAK